MRHRTSHRKLGRVTEHRISMLRNQATELLRYERIETTVARAKELRPFVERIISIAKRGLSAGEAQLVALTRVFLEDPGLVVLDEASSRLDPHTEQLLERAITRLLEGRTAIVIAHRLTTVARADVILILDNGRVAELGRRDELADDPESRFAQLLRVGLGEVLGQDVCLDAVPRAQAVRQFFEAVAGAGQQDHVVAAGGELGGELGAQSGGGAGDDDAHYYLFLRTAATSWLTVSIMVSCAPTV